MRFDCRQALGVEGDCDFQPQEMGNTRVENPRRLDNTTKRRSCASTAGAGGSRLGTRWGHGDPGAQPAVTSRSNTGREGVAKIWGQLISVGEE